MAPADPYYEKSRELVQWYSQENERLTKLEHDEQHNVPSIRTKLYPQINQWLSKL